MYRATDKGWRCFGDEQYKEMDLRRSYNAQIVIMNMENGREIHEVEEEDENYF